MINFIRTNSNKWDTVDQSQYLESIVFIEDTKQIYSNGVYYDGEVKKSAILPKVEFDSDSITLAPNKLYYNMNPLSILDLDLEYNEGISCTYFVEFICDDTCVILPSSIKWENNIIPDFTKSDYIMTLKIQDDTAYLIDCRPLYSVQYIATKKVQPNRTDAFGSEIIGVTEDKFILSGPATEIKEGAFEGNQDLISITIPNTVKRIGSKAFSGCSNLQDMEYEGNSKDWDKIELGEDWNEGTEVESVESADGDLYLESYVTFKAEEDNSSIGLSRLSTNQTLEYRRDGSNWSNMNTSTNIPLNNGDKVYVRGLLSAGNTNSNYTQFKMSGKIAASGNCNTVWNYQDLNAPLKKYCGYYMFQGCTSLVTAPELPTTTLADSCYEGMFYGCTSLTTAPELPATTLADSCYWNMFGDCSSLTTAPELPATKLAEGCYNSMFQNCTSLTTAPELPATTLADSCYWNMFRECTSLTSAPELPAMTLTEECYYQMFYRCVSLTTAPVLPATTLAKQCYRFMFTYCRSLNYIKCLATDISATDCTNSWVYGVAETGTFVKHPNMNKWSTGTSIPSGWTVENAEI